MAEVVPIFPLDVVLLPGAPLPLHIFEERYRRLIADVCAPGAPRAFGVVAIKQGESTKPSNSITHGRAGKRSSSTGAGSGVELADVGTLAEVVELEPYPDGRSDLLTIGSRRFELIEVDASSRPYLCATINWLPEDEGAIADSHLGVARRLCERYGVTLAALAGRQPPDEELAEDALRLSYQIAARLRLVTAERQGLLEAKTAAERLLAGMNLLRRETMLLTRTRTVPVSPHLLRVAPTSN
ncbi:MAG TPA: LON peptidase substrate-binding domain-containing protein [Jatrophihabitantaceae bacterium]|nr:LON peptidase substrate-binding domain-containing protein [Jatrophihabitantaceae bacterium]